MATPRSDGRLLPWLWEPGDVRELRVLGDCPPRTGYYDTPEALTEAAARSGRDPQVRGVYTTLNPCQPELLGRAARRVRRAGRGESTQDAQIVARRIMLVDCDPVRPAGINSSEAEHQAALDLAARIRDDLAAAGWPEPATVDTGNGGALWYSVDLPAEDGGLVHRCLQALAARYDAPACRVDTAVHNPSRIARVPGTLNRKGDDMPDRPQRLCRVLDLPPERVPVPRELLEHLAAALPAPEADQPRQDGASRDPGRPSAYERARAWLERRDPAVEGQGGDQWTYVTACALVVDFGLGDQEALELLAVWNQGCIPPWSEAELAGKIASARRSGTGTPGGKLEAAPPVASSDRRLDSTPHRQAQALDRMDPAAFHGPLGQLVRELDPFTEASQEAILGQALALFGNLVGRPGPFVPVGGDEHHTGLFLAIVGKSSKARKGSGLSILRKVFEAYCRGQAVDPLSTCNPASGEGLILRLKDPTPAELGDREERDYKRVIVLATELAGLLKQGGRRGSILSETYRDAWDGARLSQDKAGGTIAATGYLVSMIGHITLADLIVNLTATDQANGFGNRLIWLAATRSKLLADGAWLTDDLAAELADRYLAGPLNRARALGRRPIHRTPEAASLWKALYEGPLQNGCPGLAGELLGRDAAQLTRLQLIYALADGAAAIRPEHVLASCAFWDFSAASVRSIFGVRFGDRIVDSALEHLQNVSPGGLTRFELSNVFSRHLAASELTQALQTLEEYGLAARATRGKGKGRPSEVWTATPAPGLSSHTSLSSHCATLGFGPLLGETPQNGMVTGFQGGVYICEKSEESRIMYRDPEGPEEWGGSAECEKCEESPPKNGSLPHGVTNLVRGEI